MRKAILIKPLDGQPEGTRREFNNADFEALERLGAVRLASDDDDDIAEFSDEEVSLEALRDIHAAELKAALDRAEHLDRELASTREQLAGETARADNATQEMQAGLQAIDQLNEQLAAARASASATPQDGGEQEQTGEQKIAGEHENKMLVDPSNKAAGGKPKTPKAD